MAEPGQSEIKSISEPRTIEIQSRGIASLPDSIGHLDFDPDRVLEPGLIVTNERYDPTFFEEVKKQHDLNGYIYGAGAGNIFTMIEAFREGSGPKGLVMVDIDPAVVLAGKVLIDGFKKYESWDEFVGRVIIHNNAEEVLAAEQDEKLKELMTTNMDRFQQGIRFMGGSISGVTGVEGSVRLDGRELRKFPFDDYLAFSNYELVPMAMIARHYDQFRKLALEGNMKIVYGDLFDPELLNLVASLPEEKTSNNLVYTTNIGALTMRRSYGPKRVESPNTAFNQLKILTPEVGNQNTYVSYEPNKGTKRGSKMIHLSQPPQYRA